ncbi:hypothetical protein [Actinacidiphila sp. bgisy145]|uniref:hypothetical protein n=1 Tax=Actinacidiphila sp. bgisy145 TaxID=3413792 RepID=UPI003EBD74FF
MAYIRHRDDETPVLRPTFELSGKEIERVVPPGDRLATEGGNSGMETCGCDACRALYTELTGIEPEPAA